MRNVLPFPDGVRSFNAVQKHDNKKPYILFYGAGGGMRALLPLSVLSYIREMRQSHFIHGVDCLAGPSTASIYNAGFNRPSMDDPSEPFWSEADMHQNYEGAAKGIFHLHHVRRHMPLVSLYEGRKYNPENLQSFLTELLGDTKIGDGIKSQIIPARALKGRNFYFKACKENPEQGFASDLSLVDATLASASHPGCFPSHSVSVNGSRYDLIDGGMFDTPLHTYLEIKRMLPADREIYMIYMSTGNEPKHSYDASRFGQAGLSELFSLRRGMPLAQEKSAADFQASMHQLRQELGARLVEFSFPLDELFLKGRVPFIDDARPETIENYRRASETLISAKQETIREVADLLNWRETYDDLGIDLIPSSRLVDGLPFKGGASTLDARAGLP